MSVVSVSFAPLILCFDDERAAVTAAMEAARKLGHYDSFPEAPPYTSEFGDVIAEIPLVRRHS